MCGLPVSPVPLATFWTQSLEEREEVWERTKWIWETRLRGRPTCEVCVIMRDSSRARQNILLCFPGLPNMAPDE